MPQENQNKKPQPAKSQGAKNSQDKKQDNKKAPQAAPKKK